MLLYARRLASSALAIVLGVAFVTTTLLYELAGRLRPARRHGSLRDAAVVISPDTTAGAEPAEPPRWRTRSPRSAPRRASPASAQPGVRHARPRSPACARLRAERPGRRHARLPGTTPTGPGRGRPSTMPSRPPTGSAWATRSPWTRRRVPSARSSWACSRWAPTATSISSLPLLFAADLRPGRPHRLRRAHRPVCQRRRQPRRARRRLRASDALAGKPVLGARPRRRPRSGSRTTPAVRASWPPCCSPSGRSP